jgi:uridine kinase
MEKIKILVGEEEREVNKGIKLIDIARGEPVKENFPILGAILNNRVVDLYEEVKEGDKIKFLTFRDHDGKEIYRRTTGFILARACMDYHRNSRLVIGHSLSNGYYYDFYSDLPNTSAVLGKISDIMKDIIKNNEQIEVKVLPKMEAKELFKKKGFSDKARLLKYLEKDEVKIYKLGPFMDIAHYPLAPSTGSVGYFRLRRNPPGFILEFPRENVCEVPSFIKQTKLFKVYQESKHWGKILEVNNVGRLNEVIASGKISELIKIAEALHEKKFSAIADMILERRDDIKIILIAGPSSSGKTTFSKRLAIHLKVNGLKPVTISLDNYFVNREECPRDEKGDYDFESLYALNIELFNEHLTRLLNGEEVMTPKFDFEQGKRIDNYSRLRLVDGQMMIIEGIHGLNEKLTYSIPHKNKFKIYVSALTQLCIDDHNRIPTTDTRLIRRMVRDHKFRAYGAENTLLRWPSVRRGEEKNIFPYQEEADVMFNSALIYELSVLKNEALTLLSEISETSPVYKEAVRLKQFLSNFLPVDTDEIPPTSLLREFLGNSSFKY